MGQSYFIWKGFDCRSMGVILDAPFAIIRPEERVEHVTIPGRSGDLTLTEGENIYNSYIQTATIKVKGGFRVRNVYKWLRGSGYVTFSGEPDKKQAARVIGAITLNKHAYNLDWWVGEVQFYCQPLKEHIHENAITLTAASSFVNGGDVTAKPLWKVTPSGTSVTLTVNGKNFVITGTTSGTAILVDSDVQEITDTARTTLLTKNSTGAFPVLEPGLNTVGGSGWSKIELTKRERFL